MPLAPKLRTSRRAVLGVGAVALTAGAAQAGATDSESFDKAEAARILDRYASFGDKASGGEGDTASGAWLEAELRSSGYVCKRQAFEVLSRRTRPNGAGTRKARPKAALGNHKSLKRKTFL